MLGKRKNSRMTPPIISFGNDAFLGEEGIGLPLFKSCQRSRLRESTPPKKSCI